MGFAPSAPTWLALPDTPSAYVANQFARVNAAADAIELTGSGVGWQNVVIVDPAGGGDFTTVQAAIDSITDETSGNRYLVLMNGGDVTEALVTLKPFVFLGGRGEGVTNLRVTNAAGGGLVTADDSGVSNLSILAATTGANQTIDVPQTRLRWQMRDVRINGRSLLGAGQYVNCRWAGTINFNGATNETLPVFENNRFDIGSAIGQSITSGADSFAHISGGTVIGSSNITQQASIGGLSENIRYTGVTFINDQTGGSTGWTFTARATFAGCSFARYNGSGFPIMSPTAGNYSGCSFFEAFISANATAKPLNFSGCHFRDTQIEIVNSVSLGHFPVVISGCILEGSTTGAGGGNLPGLILDTSGSGGKRIVELNGNTYRGRIDPTFTSDLRLRGTDVQGVFFPVDTALGTGAPLAIGQHTAMDLNLAAETCFVPLRMNPPALDTGIVDALLVVSGEFDKLLDRFAEGAGNVALAAHTPDSGTGWTLVSGTATVLDASDDVEGSAGGIHTFDDGATDGFVQVKFDNPGSNSTFNHGLIFRYADSDNFWSVQVDRVGSFDTQLRLVKREAASDEIIAETDIGVGGTSSVTVGISFLGDFIKVFCDLGIVEFNLAFETEDTFNNTSPTVGLLFGGTGANIGMDDFEFWRGDSTLDITMDASAGEEGAPIERVTDSLVLTNLPVAHQNFSYVDIKNALTNVRQGSVTGMRVTLDALGTVNTALRVHGIVLRTLPTSIPVRPTQSTSGSLDAQQITYR